MNKQKKGTRKAPVAIISLALVALTLVATTLAYLTDQRTALNTLGLGVDSSGNASIQISLEEPSFAKQAGAGNVTYMMANREITAAKVFDLIPGDKIYKDPTIKNVGQRDVFLRVRMPGVSATLLADLENNFGLSINSDFVQHTDGAFYYAPGGTMAKFVVGQSIAFFDVQAGDAALGNYSMEIPLSYDMDDFEALATGGKLDIEIIVEAVQYDNNETMAIGWAGVTPDEIDISYRK